MNARRYRMSHAVPSFAAKSGTSSTGSTSRATLPKTHGFLWACYRAAAEASLLLPDGLGGRALLVFDNFRATMKWNKSVKFAASVGMIADGVERG